MSDKVQRFEENEVTTTDTFNARVDEINVAFAEIVDSGIGAIPEIKQDILERQPAERWNAMTRTILTTVVSTLAGGLVGALVAMLIK